MAFKLLCIGDISARSGRSAVLEILPEVMAEQKPDFVIANTENATHGHAISQSHFKELQAVGVNFATGGNHSFHNRDHIPLLESNPPQALRPANYHNAAPGKGYTIVDAGMKQIAIINLSGQVFMQDNVDSPFDKLEHIINVELAGQYYDFAVLDFHAEATSEKRAMFYFAQRFEKLAVMYGTHTHVQTNDAQISDGGLGYITDLGMCGLHESIIGADVEPILKRFRLQVPVKHTYNSPGSLQFNAVLFTIEGGQTVEIENIAIVKK